MLQIRQIGPHKVLLECSTANSELGASVLDKLSELHQAGPALHDGSRIQFGWSLLTLQTEDGALRVCEPDFYGAISNTQPSVNVTLEVLKAQIPVLRAVGEDGVDVRYDQVVTATQSCVQTPDLFLKRDAPQSGGDTGWFIGKLEDLEAAQPPQEVESLCVFQLLRQRFALLQLLTLPPGYLAIMRGDRLAALLDKDLKLRWGYFPG